jgi:hypothetical protein
MNWAKGRRTRGRGTSFKGALQYVLHDKGADTDERVGFIELRNLATDKPHRTWREMMALCDAADDLKKRAGVKATGRKMAKPVYAFTLNWHEADRPDADHMRQTALSALRALGMENLQAVIVEHTDRPHRHVHVIVNLIDPDTGKAAPLSNDAHKLDRWADDYEVAQGVIRSPDRRAKFHALDNGLPPPRRPSQASREEWEATRRIHSERQQQRAVEIKAAYAAKVAAIKGRHRFAQQARTTEGEVLWKTNRANSKAVHDRYQPFIDAIWKSRHQPQPHPFTAQALRNMWELHEWKKLGQRQWRQRRAFDARERSFLGVIANTVRLHFGRNGRPGIAGLFYLLVSGNERRRQFQNLQERNKKGLQERQAQSKRKRADVLRAARGLELARLSDEYRRSRRSMVERHAKEVAAERAQWKTVAAERQKTWADFKHEFAAREPTRDASNHSVSAREDFVRTAAQAATVERELSPADRKNVPADKASPMQSASVPKDEKQDAGENKNWRARRSAAERRADGSYRERERPSSRNGRSRERDPFEPR